MILKLKSNLLYTVSILSLVVPGSFFTIFLSSPINVFIYEDLPAFGRPTTENDGRSSEIKSIKDSLKTLEEDISRLESLGATLAEGPMEMPGIRIVFLKTPGDVRIELIQKVD